MAETDRPGSLFRQEALDHYARMGRDDAAPSFDPAAMRPHWRSFLAAAACLVLLGLGGLWYQVDQGPRGVLVDVADDSVVIGFTDTPPDLLGEPVVLILSDGSEVAGTAMEGQQVSGNGVTATMLLVELETRGAAAGHESEPVTVDSGRAGLLVDIFTDSGEDRS